MDGREGGRNHHDIRFSFDLNGKLNLKMFNRTVCVWRMMVLRGS